MRCSRIQLQEQGKLQFDDPIEKYVPQFANLRVLANGTGDAPTRSESKVTIAHLLTHTSGFTTSVAAEVNNSLVNDYKRQRVMTRNSTGSNQLGSLSARVTKLAEFPLLSQPGTRFNYSVGYDVAGRIAEVVTRRDLATAMRIWVFRRGMRKFLFVVPADKQARLARLYGPHGRTYQVPGKPETVQTIQQYTQGYANFGISTNGYFSGGIGVLTTSQDYS